MNKSQKILMGVVAVIVIAIAGYVLYGSKVAGQSVKVGVAAALTGDAAEWGQTELNTYQMLADGVNQDGGINGKPLQLVIEDTKSSEIGTVNAVSKLIDIDKIQVILGPTWADSFQAGNPVAEKAHVVLLSPSTAIDVIKAKQNFGYFFSTWWSQTPEADAIEKFMASKGITSIDVINDLDPWDDNFANIVVNNAKNHGLNVGDRERVPIGTNDFRSVLTKVRASRSQGIFVQVQDPLGVGSLMKQLRNLGINKQVFSASEEQNEQLLQHFSSVVEGLIYTYPYNNGNQTYQTLLRNYQKSYGRAPASSSFPNAYNAFEALVWVLKHGASSGDDIKSALHDIDIQGAGVDRVKFDSQGAINNTDFEIKTIKNGQFTTIQQ